MTLKSQLQSEGLLQAHDEQAQLRHLLMLDDKLLAMLFKKKHPIYQVVTISAMNLRELRTLQNELESKGTLAVPISSGASVKVDGMVRPIVFVTATDNTDQSHHGEMSTMLYLRDHIQAARMMMELNLRDPKRYTAEGLAGRRLLFSALDLMSTPHQLGRLRGVAKQGAAAGQEQWPHISFWFSDLQAEKPNGWRNKQDSFQMLAHLTCDAIDRGFITASELLDAHKQFLSGIVPLLLSVGFPRYESSGSWEEHCARRTSVIAVETAMLLRMRDVSQKYPDLAFFAKNDELDRLIASGLSEIGRRLPFESSDYPADSIQYRQADAALAYLLLYDIPVALATTSVPIGREAKIMTQTEIETLILHQLATLDDRVTGGVIRYRDDSYQRVNFHTNSMQLIVRAIKRRTAAGEEPSLDEKQRLRGALMPQGREAAWLHPLGQLSAWAARRSLETAGGESVRYQRLSRGYLERLLTLRTTDGMWCTAVGSDALYHIQPVSADRLPECYITYRLGDREIVTPSPHTPLNWSAATTKEAIGLLVMASDRLLAKR